MTERQEKFLKAAYELVQEKPLDPFDMRVASTAAEFDQIAGADLFQTLINDGYLRDRGGGWAYFTPQGREYIRNLEERRKPAANPIVSKPPNILTMLSPMALVPEILRITNEKVLAELKGNDSTQQLKKTLDDRTIEQLQKGLRDPNAEQAMRDANAMFEQIAKDAKNPLKEQLEEDNRRNLQEQIPIWSGLETGAPIRPPILWRERETQEPSKTPEPTKARIFLLRWWFYWSGHTFWGQVIAGIIVVAIAVGVGILIKWLTGFNIMDLSRR